MTRSRSSLVLVALASALSLAGCNEQALEKHEPVRLVRTAVVGEATATRELSFAGEVRARFETPLGFRVGGKIVSREAEVGSVVTAGQVLARLDPKDLQLAVQTVESELSAGHANLKLAQADFKRFGDLRSKGFISQSELDSRRNTLQAAQDRVNAAEAQLDQARNQVRYANLVADHDGVITAVNAEAGQVVAAGQPVLRLAQLGEKDIAISVPEQRIEDLKTAQTIAITLWADPGRRYQGRVREIAPASDPSTRTYAAKIAVDNADDALRWGMTAEVLLSQPGSPAMMLPLTALYTKTDKPSVWVVDPTTSTVNQVAVETGGFDANQVIIKSGLKAGDIVVTAGANLLIPGQPVRRMESPS